MSDSAESQQVREAKRIASIFVKQDEALKPFNDLFGLHERLSGAAFAFAAMGKEEGAAILSIEAEKARRAFRGNLC